MPTTTLNQQLALKKCHVEPGESYGTPKEFWGFRLPRQSGKPSRVARNALAANAHLLQLDAALTGIEERKVIRSLGGWHVIFEQRHLRTRIHKAYISVHMDKQKSVYLIKNRALPLARVQKVKKPDQISRTTAQQIAMKELARTQGRLIVGGYEHVWFPKGASLRLAHKFRIHRTQPRREEWLIYVDAEKGGILWKWDNLASATGTAQVFDPNPVVALRDWRLLLHKRRPVRRVPPDAYVQVKLREIARSGELTGPHVTTVPTKSRLRRRNLDFRMLSHQPGFEEVMTYFHIDSAIRYLRKLGYRNDKAIFRQPVRVNARAFRYDNSFYSPGERMLFFGTGDVDDAEDGEVILHEFGHALQDAICPDFGQSDEAAAMGEGFSDYFSASFFAGRKNKKLVPTVMTWDGIMCGTAYNPRRPPCVRRLDARLTYRDFSPRRDVHDNGEIWSATLWSIWRALGRDVADRIILESHFQLDGFTKFARGARAILDADRNLNGGRNVAVLKAIFRRRGIQPV